MTSSGDVILRVLLVLLFGACGAAQVCSGLLATSLVGGVSAVVLTGLIVVGGLCVEVVLVSVWALLGKVRQGSIFDARGRADRWTNTAIAALGTAAVFAAAGFVYFALAPVQPEATAGASTVLAIAAAAAAGAAAALALLVVVMRRLLHTAVQYQSDLAEVI
ncbi:DUF2975 domain-containing protein [Subtercola sp. Z020]|uniref:DUF2975 domain-containing protein n=1 Tax=Subtercola sp. Z020 TaxID=2080582 RepID=UPI000CE7ABA7|nr:DUF2975 domain-containing protein [Subtercola sp. Z020]PPF77337.1 DUF2975 domain-containing protein [Subtercola sp. Z020]